MTCENPRNWGRKGGCEDMLVLQMEMQGFGYGCLEGLHFKTCENNNNNNNILYNGLHK